MAIKEYAAKLIEQDATLKEIAEQKETLWVNPKFLPFEMTDAVCQLVVSDADIADASGAVCPVHPQVLPGDRVHQWHHRVPAEAHPRDAERPDRSNGQPHLRQSVPQDGQPSGGGRLRQGPRRHL